MKEAHVTRFLRLIDVAVVAAGVLLALRLDALSPFEGAALHFLIALTVVSLLDIMLPHGDSVDVDSALLVAGLYILGPETLIPVAVLARSIAHIAGRDRRKASPFINSLAKRVAGLVAATPLALLLSTWDTSRVGAEYLGVLAPGALFVLVELLYGQVSSAISRRDSVIRMLLGNLALQGAFLAAGVSVAMLTVIIYEEMTVWGLALMTFLVAIMRQSFALLIEVRSAYHSTIEALIGAMEAQHPTREGLGEKVAALARRTAAEYGWFGSKVETVGYAALLRYFSLSFESVDSATGGVRPTPLAEVRFLRPVEPLLAVLSGSGRHESDSVAVIGAYMVALALRSCSPGQDTEILDRVGSRLSERTRRRIDRVHERALKKTGGS